MTTQTTRHRYHHLNIFPSCQLTSTWSLLTPIYIVKGVMFVCLSVCIYVPYGRPNGWADRDQTWHSRTRVHPGSVSVKVNVKVIHVCVREWQNYETPGKRHLANAAQTTSGERGRRHLANGYETPSGRRLITARVTRRGATGAEQQAPKTRVRE